MNHPPRDPTLFTRPRLYFARVRPQGFEIVQLDKIVPVLSGYVLTWTAQRKLFLDRTLVCSADDGIVARSGVRCDACQHPLCRPQIRLRLADSHHVHYLVDLAVSSAQNFLAIENEIHDEGPPLATVRLRLTVIDHGYFGEVCFERVSLHWLADHTDSIHEHLE